MMYRVGEFVPSDRVKMGESTLPFELFLSISFQVLGLVQGDWNAKVGPDHTNKGQEQLEDLALERQTTEDGDS